MPTRRESPWLVRYEPRPNAKLSLVCIPCAGAGAASFRPWEAYLPDSVEVITVQLPGRESRLREHPLRSAQEVARTLAPLVSDYVHQPLVIFGYSMGAIIAFELARAIQREDPARLRHLFVSARGAPHIPIRSQKYALDDEAFRRELESYGGTPRQVLADRSLMSAIMPAIRADFEITEAYRYDVEPKLKCPITVFAGTHDALIPAETIAPWCHETVASCEVHWIAGGHFFVRDKLADVISTVLTTMNLKQAV